ncbi:death domain-containing protein [Trichonephila inaurata madagascariensis]|uniref:Death domain-containing protein n=1 Tax=Trichonephila inaurata madagascariensis TaxID=2747483 RepID=A0A8X6XPJ4_9ARAC|nr:death domain-containing protein [Trichonephila inaurata madagascariensis]
MASLNIRKMKILTIFQLFLIQQLCSGTFDINDHQLQMVADNLKMDECRKLIEALHQKGFEMTQQPKGDSEPKQVSCLRLLQHWNTHEGKGQTFHQLALRLKQLGHYDIADRLSLSVSDEKVSEVQDLFLKDPFKSKIHTNSPLLQESPHVEKLPSKQKIDVPWTTFDCIQVGLFVLIVFAFTGLVLLSLLRFFLPDSFMRMRTTLYQSFTGKRPGEEDVFFIM